MQKRKLFVGLVLSVALVVGLYFLNRHWVTPVDRNVSSGSEYPMAPLFTLPDLMGEDLSLADYKGRVVLLNFWATWCGPCREEIPDFVKLVENYGNRGFIILGISMDDGPEPVHDFYEEFKMNYPVVMGSAQVSQLYGGVFGIPTSFLIGRDGRIYSRHVGLVPLSVIEGEINELLAHDRQEALEEFHAVSGNEGANSESLDLGRVDVAHSEVPGVDLAGLSGEQKEVFRSELAKEDCTCKCGLNLLKCRVDDTSCSVSLVLAKQKLDSL